MGRFGFGAFGGALVQLIFNLELVQAAPSKHILSTSFTVHYFLLFSSSAYCHQPFCFHGSAMRYGYVLAQYSVPEWKAYAVDYDEFKELIKNTVVLGAGVGNEDIIYAALSEQIDRVCLNVWHLFRLYPVSLTLA